MAPKNALMLFRVTKVRGSCHSGDRDLENDLWGLCFIGFLATKLGEDDMRSGDSYGRRWIE